MPSTASRLLLAVGGLVLVGLCGCTSTDPGLGVKPRAAIAGSGASASSVAAAAAPGATGALAETAPGAAARAEVQFLPVIGAPPEKVAALSRALAANAGANGVAILPSTAPTPPLRLKGYFSAVSEGSNTVVIYVWDVLDPRDERVHRIQGQERVAGTAADPWSLVSDSTLASIAAATLRQVGGLTSARTG
ncbi:hypothetical protein [Mangrovibrevibacter kandeliae]|uniref:hypothetical protein n=1 Tax=Mangrovibrevibacter kandeliae TaxID=2968473 RepID=UPI002117637A|nr:MULTISPECIES: hypothetical protein [unclassified Aurantimonas]MCQ8781024.1 hypothetical protein [Aurantimonas sp. CSK15Z-1]MCW4113806.1 hypothetical protein [Aurantimonas sp. MSK8Z-1]